VSKLDQKKAELGFWEKSYFGGLAAEFGLMGWFSANYQNAELAFLVASIIAFAFMLALIIASYRKIQKILKKIGEL
jgi:amino acid transporter